MDACRKAVLQALSKRGCGAYDAQGLCEEAVQRSGTACQDRTAPLKSKQKSEEKGKEDALLAPFGWEMFESSSGSKLGSRRSEMS